MPRRLLAVLALVAVILLILWLRRHQPAPAAATAEAPTPAQGPHWTLVPPPEVARLEAGRKANRARPGLWMLEDPNLPMIVADSLIVSRFPRDSLPLTHNQIGQLEPNRRWDTRSPVLNKDSTVEDGLQVLFTGDKFRLVGDQTLLMTLALFKSDQQVPVKVVSAVARAKAIDGAPLGLELPVSFSDRGDLTEMATLRLSGTPLAKHAGKVDVDIEYETGSGKVAQARLDALYQPEGTPPAKFNGKFREEMKSGSLEIYAGVDVVEAGEYMIEANLLDANRQPAVYMVARIVPLQPGTSEVRLEAFGRVIREASSASPFILTNLRGYIFYRGKDPDRKLMPDYTDDYQTAKYPLDGFSDAEYWDQDKADQIGRLQQAAKEAPPGSPNAVTIGEASAQGWKPNW